MQQNNITEITVEIGKITVLTLCGKNDLNILNAETIINLSEQLDLLMNNESIEVLIITGKGEKAFCSGADIRELADINPFLIESYVKSGAELYEKIQNFPAPVIGVINGYAFGAAFELLLACDIRFMAEETQIGQPAVMHGLVPPFGGTYRLPKIVGVGNAKDIIFSASVLDAKSSQKIGLVNKIYPRKDLMSEAIKYSENICKNKSYAVKMSKKLINQRIYDQVDYLDENKSLEECLHNSETRDQLMSFFRKKKTQV